MTTPSCATVGGDLWTSDVESDRPIAADICKTCPLRRPCYELADHLRREPYDAREDRDSTFRPSGVWGGFLFYGSTRPPNRVVPLSERSKRSRTEITQRAAEARRSA